MKKLSSKSAISESSEDKCIKIEFNEIRALKDENAELKEEIRQLKMQNQGLQERVSDLNKQLPSPGYNARHPLDMD